MDIINHPYPNVSSTVLINMSIVFGWNWKYILWLDNDEQAIGSSPQTHKLLKSSIVCSMVQQTSRSHLTQ